MLFFKRHKKGPPLWPDLVNLKSNTMKNTRAKVITFREIRKHFFQNLSFLNNNYLLAHDFNFLKFTSLYFYLHSIISKLKALRQSRVGCIMQAYLMSNMDEIGLLCPYPS